MDIRQKRIRNLERHLPENLLGQSLRFGLSDLVRHFERLKLSGFCDELTPGACVLPKAIGPVTRFNAEGKNIVRRDLPMETAFRQVEWTWIEYHGRDEEEKSEVRDVPYRRYPRDFVPPPSLELRIVLGPEGRKLAVTEPFCYDEAARDGIRHAINVCLELFGECEIFTPDLISIVPPAERLNWHILPPGKYPWERLQSELKTIVDRAKPGKRPIILSRWETINKHKPDFVAAGEAGFDGYIVFGFTTKDIYVVESAYYGNATYVFDKDWETLSRMTKAEILNQDLQKDRVIHISSWPARINTLLRGIER
jgi:hypothetical protein